MMLPYQYNYRTKFPDRMVLQFKNLKIKQLKYIYHVVIRNIYQINKEISNNITCREAGNG